MCLRNSEPAFSKMPRTCEMLFSFELTLVSNSGWLPTLFQVFARDTDSRLFCSFYLYLTILLRNHHVFFLPIVTFTDDPFAYMLNISGGCVLKESLVLRHLGLGRGLFKPEEKKFKPLVILSWEWNLIKVYITGSKGAF